MPVNFRQRAADLEEQLARVRKDLESAEPAQKRRLIALEASLKRSLRWYIARAGTRSDIHALRVNVAEHIKTHEAGT